MEYTKIAKIFAKTLIQEISARVGSDPTHDLLRRARDFVKYHNAFSIILVVTIVATGSVMASEPGREMLAQVVGEEIVVEKGIDNAALLEIDLDAFDMEMTINAVSEDSDNYYVEFSYHTIGIMDNMWKKLFQEEIMTVSKAEIKGKDLGLYLTEELGEIADCELVFLREMQTKETEKGKTEIVETTEYSGLIGLVLDVKNKILPDYEPVVKPEIVVQQQTAAVVPVVQTPEPIDAPVVVDDPPISPDESAEPELPADNPSVDEEPPANEEPPTDESADDPVPEPLSDTFCDTDHVNLCDTQELCEIAGLFWYNEVCNLEAEPEPQPEPILGCADETALNYNPEVTQDDGSCEYLPAPILGCMDLTALNYNPEATQDDGTCEYPPPTCESFTYSDYTECQLDGTQTRTVLTSSPEACVDGEPVLSQPCEYTPEPESEN